jgi:hypothetical protein
MDFAPSFGARITAALVVAAAVFTLPAATLASEADAQCLACHGQEGLTKAFSRGEPLALHVDGAAFEKSVHAPLGCTGCHATIDVAKHPGGGAAGAFESARAYAVAGMQTCRNCHGPIFEAFAKSVHGADTSGAAPVCADCHSVHRVARASVGMHLRESCVSCHAAVRDTHAKWLPNTARHLDTVACAACHAPGARKRLELRLFDPTAGVEKAGIDPLEAASAPLDAPQLRKLLAEVNRGGAERLTFIARLEARTGEETHGLARRHEALRDCAACHRKGADPFQSVSLSIVGPDGKRIQYETSSEALHSPATIGSMRRFYAPGGTRIEALDIVLALALAGGILAPLGHLVVRRVLRRKEGKK